METKQKHREAKVLITWYLLFSALLVLMCQQIEAQPSTAKDIEHKAWLRLENEPTRTNAAPVMVTDSILSMNDPGVHEFEFSSGRKGKVLENLFSGTGTGIGTTIGSIKVKFSIKGEIQTFETINKKIKQYSLRQCMR